jgi:hypothetical protein
MGRYRHELPMAKNIPRVCLMVSLATYKEMEIIIVFHFAEIAFRGLVHIGLSAV